jgi:hypothetical protein
MTAITAHRTSGIRVTALASALVIAAILGLAVGNALQALISTESRTATAVFSMDALDAVRVTRGDGVASAADAASAARYAAAAEAWAAAQAAMESDFALRHAPAAAPPAESFSTQTYADWHRDAGQDAGRPATQQKSGAPQLE